MQIEVYRDMLTVNSAVSRISVNNVPMWYGLEPPLTREGEGPVAIPEGVFTLSIVWSPKHQFYVPLVNDVPGHTAIEIHPGDFPQDTLGCLLVGMTRSVDRLYASRDAWSQMFCKILEAIPKERVTIAYANRRIPAADEQPPQAA